MLCERANIELQKVSIWLKANKLTLNVTKTQYIIFKSRKKKLNKNIDINNKLIKRTEFTKFLGVYIDEQLEVGNLILIMSLTY